MRDYNKIIIQWEGYTLPEIIERDIKIDLESGFITSIIGPRRAGKTYICFQVIKELKKENKNTLYINFEDNKLLGATAEDLDKLLETFYELSENDPNEKLYLFLDEIQNVQDWDIWVRKIYDLNKKIVLIITGSSSKLLSKEISTHLRGRVLSYEVFPLSFSEFLRFHKISYNIKKIGYGKEYTVLKKYFLKILKDGGYPALVGKDHLKEQVLNNYYDSMIMKDIMERYNIREVRKLKILAKLIFDSITNEISYNKLFNKVKTIGYEISKSTIIEYISYFEDAYIFMQSYRYSFSQMGSLTSPKKIYCIDNGLLNAVSFSFSENKGKLLENLIYLELRRRNYEVFYHRKNYECDFILISNKREVHAIQVTQRLHDDNMQRETQGLLEAMSEYKLKQGLILTETGDEQSINPSVKVKSVIKWLLEK